jgi:hypothetical protein
MPNLGPKTGTFEPPHHQPLHKEPNLWNTFREMEEEIGNKDKKIKELIQLTIEIIAAHNQKDKTTLDYLVKEFEKFKKEYNSYNMENY